MADSGEMALEQERVLQVLQQAVQHLAGQDLAESARQGHPRVRYSPLRTAVEQAATSAERVLLHLRST